MKWLLALCFVVIGLVVYYNQKPPPPPPIDPRITKFEALRQSAQQAGETPEGKAYEKAFTPAVSGPLRQALLETTAQLPKPFKVTLVFIVDANGVANRIVTPPDSVLDETIAEKLGGSRLPIPPHDDWLVLVQITVTD
jgi:hypothetical protein